MTVEFAEPISSIPSLLETDEKRMIVEGVENLLSMNSKILGYVILRVARSSRNSALKTLAIMVETAFKTTLIQPSYGSLS